MKSLATQTSKATDAIGVQISQIQAATSNAVGAIQSIVTTISEMNEIASEVAAAVEQQRAATHDIAESVQRAANSAHEVKPDNRRRGGSLSCDRHGGRSGAQRRAKAVAGG